LPSTGVRVGIDALRDWTLEVIMSLGTPQDIAVDVTDALIAADLRGVTTHGTFKLPVYVAVAQAGTLDVAARPTRDGGTDVLAVWDAHDGWGQHGGRVMMDDAIERAATLGMAASLARHACHFGIAGWYAMRAASRGSIGVVLTNTAPLVAPTRGRARILGTNPIAVAAPAGSAGMFVLDMATSAITWGRVLTDARHDETLPQGVAIDRDGRVTTDPAEVLDGGALLGLGGSEATGGHKGYGLALAIDILTGVLAGAAFGSSVVPQWSKADRPSDLGQLFMAIDPGALGDPSFETRMQRYMEELRASPRSPEADGPVLVHGDPEAEHTALQRDGGIRMSLPDHTALVSLGERLDIPFPSGSPFEDRT
jgi:LDH2 family malate/lactate/ureidoglycolate dehydrogenase